MEASADRRLIVRKITDVHANYSAREDGQSGQFSFQLILDDGAQEHLVLADAKDAKPLLRLLRASDTAYIDTEKRAISLGRLGP